MEVAGFVGPILFARGADDAVCRVAALVVAPDDREPPELVLSDGDAVRPTPIYTGFGRRAWRYDLELPAVPDAAYRIGDSIFSVAADFTGDLRIAYVSCNGQEHEDLNRPLDERNEMWRRLARDHDEDRFNLILHGGDQLYADEVVQTHPRLEEWADSDPDDRGRYEFTGDMRLAAERFYLERYQHLLSQPAIAAVAARIPAIMIWDDHDIVDGWGSRPEPILDSPVGRGLHAVARRMFMLFQRGCGDEPGSGEPRGSPAQPPTRPNDAGGRNFGATVTEVVRFPKLTIVAPDLRTERRPTRVMGPAAWAAFERGLASAKPGDRILIMSSVPILGPRLSWVERLMTALPRMQKYEDDLRDQWQSRVHRDEWRRMLEALERHAHEGSHPITIVSGEIHLATRAEMPFKDGSILHQLVSSGIAHTAPGGLYPRALERLASFGEDPLHGQRITLKPLPGRRRVYTAERNYLVMERSGGDWTAMWHLEESGRTPPLTT